MLQYSWSKAFRLPESEPRPIPAPTGESLYPNCTFPQLMEERDAAPSP